MSAAFDMPLRPAGAADSPAEMSARWMVAQRPRLLRLARAQGIAPEGADDVAQETLLEAWRLRADLSSTGGRDAWLAAICRNVARRHLRACGRRARRQSPLVETPAPYDEDEDGFARAWGAQFTDPRAFDPAEELERRELEMLLDRALSHLPPPARDAIELCYLAELPRREAALRLGLTISALEARLHRARRQLRQIFAGALRADAEACGLALDAEMAAGWRETRLHCHTCGRLRRGIFETDGAGRVSLRLRCPGCARELATRGIVPLGRARSFLPAYKRMMRYTTSYLTDGLASGAQPCPFCGALQPVRLVGLDAAAVPTGGRSGVKALMACAACGAHVDLPISTLALWHHTEAQRFMAAHPRWIQEPDTPQDYLGAPAIRARLTDLTSASRLTVLIHAQTLQPLAIFHD